MQMSGAEGVSGIIVQGGESYGLDDPRAEMDLLRHEIDISIDQKLKGVEKRLQVSHALTALRQHLMTDLDNRFQLFDSRLQVRNMRTFSALAVAFIMNHSCLQIGVCVLIWLHALLENRVSRMSPHTEHST